VKIHSEIVVQDMRASWHRGRVMSRAPLSLYGPNNKCRRSQQLVDDKLHANHL